jgi:hypothetical protein
MSPVSTVPAIRARSVTTLRSKLSAATQDAIIVAAQASDKKTNSTQTRVDDRRLQQS